MGGVLCRDRGLGNFSQNRIQNAGAAPHTPVVWGGWCSGAPLSRRNDGWFAGDLPGSGQAHPKQTTKHTLLGVVKRSPHVSVQVRMGVLIGMLAWGCPPSNRSPGVTVTSGANPVFERNVISDGEDCGVCIGSLGRGSFIENTIQKNAEDGVPPRHYFPQPSSE